MSNRYTLYFRHGSLMNKLLFLFLIFVSFSLKGQEVSTDSLYLSFKNSKGEERINNILPLFGNIPFSTIDKISAEALLSASKLNKESLDLAYLIRGKYFFEKKIYDSADIYFKKIIVDSLVLSNSLTLIKAYFSLAVIALEAQQKDSALYWAEKIKAMAVKSNVKDYKVYYLFLKMIAEKSDYFYLGAIDYLNQAISILLEQNNNEDLAYSYLQLSDAYINIQQKKEAQYVILQAVKIQDKISLKLRTVMYYILIQLLPIENHDEFTERELLFKMLDNATYLEDDKLLTYTYNALTIYYARHEKPDSALYYNDAVRLLSQKSNDVEVTFISYLNSLALYESQNQFNNIKPTANQAKQYILQKLDKPETKLILLYITLIQIYLKKRNFHTASAYLDTIDILSKSASPSTKEKVYAIKANYYKTAKQYNLALKYKEMQSDLSDSLQEVTYKKRLNDIYSKYTSKKKEQENLILKQKLKTEQQTKEIAIFISLLIFAVFLILLGIYIIFRKNALHRRALHTETVKRLEKEKKLKEQERKTIEQEKLLLKKENTLLATQKEITNEKLKAHKSILQVTNNSLLHQSQLTENLLNTLKTLRPYCNTEGKRIITSFIAEQSGVSKEKNWQAFEQNFIVLFPFFIRRLEKELPDLTVAEKHLCCFIKMQLSTSEISRITFQSNNTISVLKRRIRIKMGFENNDELKEFILNFE